MRRWIVPAIAAVLLAIAFIGTVSRQVHVRHERAAGTIISLAPNATEIVFALGLRDRLVGVSTACDYPPEARQIQKAGDFGAPNLELIYSLKPDLVIITTLRDPETADVIRRSGARLLVIPQATVEDVFRAIQQIADAADVSEAGRSYAEQLRSRMARVAQAVPHGPRPRVFVEISENPLCTAGRGSFLDELIEQAGGQNVAHDLRTPWPTISPETVVALDPQIIVVAHPVKDDARSFLSGRVGWNRISAVRSNQVIAGFDLDLLLRPGPRLVDGLELLAGLIARHREAAAPPAPDSARPLVLGIAGALALLLLGSVVFRIIGSRGIAVSRSRKTLGTGILLLSVSLLLVFFWSLVAGSAEVPLAGLLDPAHASIVKLRAARALLGMIAGAGLAIAGLILQGVLRNPLADPYVLGVSSGAGLGAAYAILGPLALLGAWTTPVAAFAGAIAAIALVYLLARVGKTVPIYTLLLAGVIVNSVASSVLIFLAHTEITHGEKFPSVMWWLLGSLRVFEGWPVAAAGIAVALGFLITILFTRDLNVLSLGEEPAAHLGVRVERTKKVLFLVSSLVTGATVATCGLIGFVGLIIPHAVRLVAGPDHKVLVPLCALAGAAFLVVADIIARTALPASELPIGVVTAFVGGPFFIYLLRTHRGGQPR